MSTDAPLAKMPEYNAWRGMRTRCTNPGHRWYHRYGGRGIKICARWSKFETFLNDVGARPSGKHSLDRINNDGDYEPSNVRWATCEQQSHNRSTATGERHGSAKLTEREVRLIRRLCVTGTKQNQAATRFGVSAHTVSLIVRGILWRHING